MKLQCSSCACYGVWTRDKEINWSSNSKPRLLSVLVSFREEKIRITEELLRQCVSQCVFAECLNDWRAFLIELFY